MQITRSCRFLLLAAILLPGFPVAAHAAESPDDASHEKTSRLIGAALTSSRAYDDLAWLCDHFSERLSGSPALDQAIEWALARMKEDGFSNVHREPVTVPHWVRGEERGWIVEPIRRDISLLGLGMSVGTPAGGIEAPVVVVGSFAGLDSLGEAGVKGRIVLFDVPFVSYGKTVEYRSKGASKAARHGAVAVLVRSVGPVSLDTPHTGRLEYEKGVPEIPAAAVTIEEATRLHRMAARGETIRVHLEMGAKLLPPAVSANVIGEIPGSGSPEEIVVISGHLDSWDVGQGAQDDGVGCTMALEVARLIDRLELRPRRTIRVVLFTNEENGVAGGKAYREAHAAELRDHVAAIESDGGSGPASGFDVDIKAVGPASDSLRTEGAAKALRLRALALLDRLAPDLAPLRAARMAAGGSGTDVGPMVEAGVAGLGLRFDTSHYFDVHHTRADTFDKIDRADLARNTAILAVATYFLADMPETLIGD